MTIGKKALRCSVMGYDVSQTGWNCSIFGYMSRGDIVPEVITTDENRSKTGWIAREGSRHLPCELASEKQRHNSREVEDRVGYRRVLRFVRLQNEQKPFLVGCNQSAKASNLLKGIVFVYIC